MNTNEKMSYDIIQPPVTAIGKSQVVGLKSAVKKNYRQTFLATGNVNFPTINFVITPAISSPGTVLDPTVTLNFPLQIIIKKKTGNWDTLANSWIKRKCGLSQFPMMRIIKTLTVNINGQSIQREPSEYLNALSLYNDLTDPSFQSQYSFPDFFPEFNSTLDGNTAAGRNPLGVVGESEKYMSRAVVDSVNYSDVNGTVSATATPYLVLKALVRMALPISMFSALGEKVGISQLKRLDINISTENQHAKLISMFDSSPVDTVTASFYDTPYCTTYWKDPQSFITEGASTNGKLNRSIHPYNNMMPFTSHSYEIKAGQSVVIPGSNIPLNKVPSKLFIFAEKDLTSSTPESIAKETTTFGYITDLSVSYMNSNNHFADFNDYDLHQMCARNGYLHDYYTSSLNVGSVICIDFAKDVSLGELFIGEEAQSLLQVRATCKNLSTLDKKFRLRVVVVDEHNLIIEDGVTTITDSVKLDAKDKEDLVSRASKTIATRSEVIGGSFLTGIWNGIKKGIQIAPDVIGIAKKLSGGYTPTIAGSVNNKPYANLGVGVTVQKGAGIDSGSPYTRLT